MTKAQEVRSRRLEKRSDGITAEAEKIFSWILDLMDEDTERGYNGSLEILLYDHETIIKKATLDGKEYDATEAVLKYNRYTLFATLATVVKREDGFDGKFMPYARYEGRRCIMFNVVIK